MSSITTTSAQICHLTIEPSQYRRGPLTPDEKRALTLAVRPGENPFGNNQFQYAREELLRFQKPIYDVLALRTSDIGVHQRIRRLLYIQMLQRSTSFWEWSREEWIESIGLTIQDYKRKYGFTAGRLSLMDCAYLLGGVNDLREIGQRKGSVETARLYFGAEVVDCEIKRITSVLLGREGQGYSARRQPLQKLTQAFAFLFLLNRSPYLEHISFALLRAARQEPDGLSSPQLVKAQIGLQRIGILAAPWEKKVRSRTEALDTTGIPEAWVQWCRAWLRPYPKITPHLHNCYVYLLLTGRWLAEHHPEVVEPSQWDEELALDYVSYICTTASVGDYASAAAKKVLETKGTAGKPLAPNTMQRKLSVMIRFFAELQEKPHQAGDGPPIKIERRFNPDEAFALPSSIRRLIQPDPRDIDEVIWCKLTYAAATLTKEDHLVALRRYPLSYYHAAALLWVTSARRPSEITRLQTGCIRRDWDPAMLDEHGIPLPGQEAQICYLHIPSNKTKGPYWVPVPRYAADAVEAWERERPTNLPVLVDPKDNAQVHFLFCVRGQKMGPRFINRTLIPALCKRAGVPESDARGAITGHRARSTIATMLRRNGLSLEDIAEFLGHANSKMVRAYARTDPFRFGRDMKRANDLMRIVEGIVDTRAAKAGKPNVFFFLGRGSDGQPRFCGNPAWDKCKHRLACLKCPMYVGSSQASRLVERLEARDEIFKFQTQMEMTPQEKAATEGDIETLTALIEADADIPPPELPSEQFRFNASVTEVTGSSLHNQAQTGLVTLAQERAALMRDLAAAEQRTDGRNASIRALKKRIAKVTEQMVTLDQISGLTKANLSMEEKQAAASYEMK